MTALFTFYFKKANFPISFRKIDFFITQKLRVLLFSKSSVFVFEKVGLLIFY